MALREKLTPAIVAVVTTLIYVDTHSLHPFLSHYATKLGASIFLAGVIVAAYSLFEDLFEIPLGYIIDRVGRRKPFVLAGLAGDGVMMILYALSRNPLYLLLTRVGHGFTGSFAGPSIMSLTADIPHPLSKLGARMGLYGSTIILATIIGWVLGGVIATYIGYETLFYVVAALLFAGFALSLLIAEPEPFALPPEKRKLSAKELLGELRVLFSSSKFLTSIAAIFVHMMSMGALATLLAPHIANLGLKPVHTAMLLVAFALTCLILQVPAGSLSERIGRGSALALGLAVEAASVLALASTVSLPLMTCCMVAYGGGYALTFPASSAATLELSRPGSRSLASAVFHVAYTEGVVVGALLFSLVASVAGYPAGLAAPAVPLALMAFAVLSAWRHK